MSRIERSSATTSMNTGRLMRLTASAADIAPSASQCRASPWNSPSGRPPAWTWLNSARRRLPLLLSPTTPLLSERRRQRRGGNFAFNRAIDAVFFSLSMIFTSRRRTFDAHMARRRLMRARRAFARRRRHYARRRFFTFMLEDTRRILSPNILQARAKARGALLLAAQDASARAIRRCCASKNQRACFFGKRRTVSLYRR